MPSRGRGLYQPGQTFGRHRLTPSIATSTRPGPKDLAPRFGTPPSHPVRCRPIETVGPSAPIPYPTPRRCCRSTTHDCGRHSAQSGNFPTHSPPTQNAGTFPQVSDPRSRPRNQSLETPLRGIREEGPDQRFRRSGPLRTTRWQVKDSNLRSFRDGFTARRARSSDLHKRTATTDFDTNSAQILDAVRC